MKSSIIHLYLYGRIKREVNGATTIHISRIHPIIKWVIRLPKKYHTDIVKELIDCGLLKKLDRDNYMIVDINRAPLCDSLGDPLW